MARQLHIRCVRKGEGTMIKKNEQFENDMPTLRIVPIATSSFSEERQKAFMELQLAMATSSINHEYARMEFEDTDDRTKQEELLLYMQECRTRYFEARESLERFDPEAVLAFERDLLKQKMQTMTEYNA